MTHTKCLRYFPHRYLREVGFPDSVLEARLSRIAAYKSLYAQNHSTTPEDSIRIESPKIVVSFVSRMTVVVLCMCVFVGLQVIKLHSSVCVCVHMCVCVCVCVCMHILYVYLCACVGR